MTKDVFTYTQEETVQLFEDLFWHGKIRCPRCENFAYRLSSRPLYQCKHCRYQFSIKSISIMRKSHLSLKTWLCAIAIICEGNINGVSLAKHLGVSYKAAWLLFHKVRNLMRALSAKQKHHLRHLLRKFFLLPGIKKVQREKKRPFQLIECDSVASPTHFHIHLVQSTSCDSLKTLFSSKNTAAILDAPEAFSRIFQQLVSRLENLYHHGCRKHPQRYIDEFCLFLLYQNPDIRMKKLLSMINREELLLPYRTLIEEPIVL
ncbi:MAG: transposase [Brevinematales bacterium]|nr:transposase [Brevinematales bacterium]